MSNVEELAHAFAGAGGGALSMIVTYPLVTLSTLAQTTQKKKDEKAQEEGTEKKDEELKAEEVKELHRKIISYITKSASWQAAQEMIKEKGVLGLYAGLESALYGITLTNFVYYYFYELTSNVFLKANATTLRRGRGLSTWQSIVTGAVAGAITSVGTNPFWVANTRIMTAKKDGAGPVTNSTFKKLFEIVQKDGFPALFAGVLPALVLVINPIIQYTVFEQLKNAIVARKGKKSFTAVNAFFIGAFGKLVSTSLTYPYITLKSRMHIREKRSKGDGASQNNPSMIKEIQKIIKEEGIEGLYRGLSVKLVQSISTAAFLFYFKEELLSGSVRLVQLLRLVKLRKSARPSV